MDTRRLVEFVVSSRVWTGSELLHHLGPADEPVETKGDTVGRFDTVRVIEKSAWVASSGLSETALIEDHLAALHRRVKPIVDSIVLSGKPPVDGLLRIVQYISTSEPQGHGFTIGAEWIELLENINGAIDVDQYLVTDTTL